MKTQRGKNYLDKQSKLYGQIWKLQACVEFSVTYWLQKKKKKKTIIRQTFSMNQLFPGDFLYQKHLFEDIQDLY